MEAPGTYSEVWWCSLLLNTWVGFGVGVGKLALEAWGVRLHLCRWESTYFVVEVCLWMNVYFCGPASLNLAQYSSGYEKRKQIPPYPGRHTNLILWIWSPTSYSPAEVLKARKTILKYKLDHGTSAQNLFCGISSLLG